MTAELVLAFLKRFGLPLVLALALGLDHLALLAAHRATEECQHTRQVDELNITAEVAKAAAADMAHARTVEQANAKIAEEKQHALETELAAARRAAADYARLHPAPQTAAGSGEAADVPRPAEPAAGADERPAEAVVPSSDLDACAVGYTVARGWQDWWSQVTKENTDDKPDL